MSIGKNLAFPRSGIRELDGMTYRQWLIGQIAARRPTDPEHDNNADKSADWIIYQADRIIARLDAEQP